MTEVARLAYPRTYIFIVGLVGGLSVFLFIASTVLVQQPIGSTVRGYFYAVDRSKEVRLDSSGGSVSNSNYRDGSPEGTQGSILGGYGNGGVSLHGDSKPVGEGGGDEGRPVIEKLTPGSVDKNDFTTSVQVESKNLNNMHPYAEVGQEEDGITNPPSSDTTAKRQSPVSNNFTQSEPPESLEPSAATTNSKADGVHSVQVESKNLNNTHPYAEVGQEEDGITNPPSSDTAAKRQSPVSNNFTQTEPPESLEPSAATTNLKADGVHSGCDLYHGKWIYDPTGPLYTNNSCPVITQMQNCQGNGRPDKEYENWRWKPSDCDLPRFDPKMFLELMRGKTVAFIGDSVARNQMESMLCILWQVEVPKNRGNRKMQRYYFRSTSTMIVRIWSSWLVHQTPEPFEFAPDGVVKLHLDFPHEVFMDYISGFDVIVLSSGHWFAKQSVYILNNEIVGGQLWWPDNSRQKKIDNIEAFGISVENILTAIGTHPNYTGLTLVRTFSPDHYEGGEWNTGGSCTGKERPILEGELVENHFINIMHKKQVTGFYRAMEKKTNKSKMKLMDITKAFSYRHDGHPGPYRSPDPNKITQRGPDGRPPPQDCLHWCMPGPVDTWNELVFENIRRVFQDIKK